MTSKDSLLPDLTIVLIGKVGAGKTTVLKTLQRVPENNEEPAYGSCVPLTCHTDKCQQTKLKINNQSVVVVDTPGLSCDDAEKVAAEIRTYISSSVQGPFVFLFVMEPGPFTEDEEVIVGSFWKTFDGNPEKFTLVLFTQGDRFKAKNQTVADFIKGSEKLNNFVTKCKGEHFVIDNKNPDVSEVTELLQRIRDMVDKNEGKGYDCEKAERNAGLKKKIRIFVSVFALAGAGVGSVVTHFAGITLGIPVGLAVGAAVGAVVGGVAVVAVEHIKDKLCVRQ